MARFIKNKVLHVLALIVLCSCAEKGVENQAVDELAEHATIIQTDKQDVAYTFESKDFISYNTFKEDTSYKELLRLKDKQEKLSDCEFAVKNAKHDFAKGEYSFHSPEFQPVECTYCDVLRMDYYIRWYFIGDIFTDKYWHCYDSTMTVHLKEKYSEDFLQRAREKADSLDRSGTWHRDPSFKGGEKKLRQYQKFASEKISAVLKGPTDSTMVVLSFIIDISGAITNPKVLKGVNEEVDSVALEVIRQMPNWDPAYRYGELTPMGYVVPFKIGKNN